MVNGTGTRRDAGVWWSESFVFPCPLVAPACGAGTVTSPAEGAAHVHQPGQQAASRAVRRGRPWQAHPMNGTYVGYVADHDPLLGFLSGIGRDHLGVRTPRPAFRAYRLSGSNEVY